MIVRKSNPHFVFFALCQSSCFTPTTFSVDLIKNALSLFPSALVEPIRPLTSSMVGWGGAITGADLRRTCRNFVQFHPDLICHNQKQRHQETKPHGLHWEPIATKLSKLYQRMNQHVVENCPKAQCRRDYSSDVASLQVEHAYEEQRQHPWDLQ